MGIREKEILNKIRETLNDTDETNYRWTDKRLYEHLDDAQEDMCRNLSLISRSSTIVTSSGIETYFLPLETVRVLSAKTGKKRIPITSADELDSNDPEWEEKVASSYEALVVNELTQNEVRPYPLISTSQTNAEDITIKVRYSALATRLGWDEATQDIIEELTISPMWDFALRQYSIGMAFLDYGDESNITRSTTAMQFYGREMQRAKKLSKKGFAKRQVISPYQAKVASNNRLQQRGQRHGR